MELLGSIPVLRDVQTREAFFRHQRSVRRPGRPNVPARIVADGLLGSLQGPLSVIIHPGELLLRF